jgi:hypothetical protein
MSDASESILYGEHSRVGHSPNPVCFRARVQLGAQSGPEIIFTDDTDYPTAIMHMIICDGPYAGHAAEAVLAMEGPDEDVFYDTINLFTGRTLPKSHLKQNIGRKRNEVALLREAGRYTAHAVITGHPAQGFKIDMFVFRYPERIS